MVSRAASHGIRRVVLSKVHVDLWRVSRNTLKLSSYRLENVARFFRLGTGKAVFPQSVLDRDQRYKLSLREQKLLHARCTGAVRHTARLAVELSQMNGRKHSDVLSVVCTGFLEREG